MKRNQLEHKPYNPISAQHNYNQIDVRLSKSPATKINNALLSQHVKIIHEQESKGLKQRDYQEWLFQRVVQIQKPELIKQGLLTSYKLYKIKTKKSNTEYYDSIVDRRFNDFEFLHHQIIDHYGGYVIPKLPQKNFWANLNLQANDFAQLRTKQLQKYLDKLLSHTKIRYSDQLRHFLFDELYDFSFNKGQFSQQNATIQGIKSIRNSVYDISKTVYTKIVGKKQRRFEFSKKSQQEEELKLFQREVDDLIKVTKGISNIINQSFEEFTLIHQLSTISNQPHLSDLALQQQFIIAYKQLIVQFQGIADFIENCKEAIIRTKSLRTQIEELQDQQAAIELKERENPRNRDLDIIRSKIQKANIKSQKWINSLRKQLSAYTCQGKTLMEQFVKKFTQLKAQIYASAQF